MHAGLQVDLYVQRLYVPPWLTHRYTDILLYTIQLYSSIMVHKMAIYIFL